MPLPVFTNNSYDFWIKADAGVTASGTTITQVIDQSSNGSVFTAPTNVALMAPGGIHLNGRPAFNFNGVDSEMSAPNPASGTPSGTYFALVYPTFDNGVPMGIVSGTPYPTSGAQGILLDTHNATKQVRYLVDGVLEVDGGADANVAIGQAILVTCMYDSATHTSKIYTNGVLKHTDSATVMSFSSSITDVLVGKLLFDPFYFAGLIAEIIHFPSALNDIDRISVETYLTGTYVSPVVTVTAVTPNHGVIGAAVVISGTNFDATPTNNHVSFNGQAAVVLFASSTQLTVSVPAGAATGPISVTVAGNTGTWTGPFTIDPAVSITSFSPTDGFPGVGQMTLTGVGFDHTAGNNVVSFSGPGGWIFAGTAANVAPGTQILVSIPPGIVTGPIKCVTGGNSSITSTNFTVLGAPILSSVGSGCYSPGCIFRTKVNTDSGRK